MPLDDNPTHSQLSIGASFANALAFSECVREEAIRSNKQLERQPGGGRNCIFKCASPGCGWFIQANLTTIRRDGIAGNYVVKKSQTQHAEDCSCTRKITSSELSQNAVFRDAIQRIGNGTRAQIEAELKISGIYTNSLSLSAFYRAKKAALHEISCGSDHTMTTSNDNDNNNLYRYLPSYLEQFCKLNGHSTCALQLDSKGRFLRCFLCPGSAVHVFGASFQILWTIGMQSKTEDYVGVHLFLIGRDATGGSFPLAVSFIPNESCFHMSWFIQMCLQAGFPMQDVPIFSHRGNLLAAACHLKKQLGVELNVKYCREYIAQNIVETFKVPSQHLGQVKQGVYMVQEAPTFAGYDAALEALEKETSSRLTQHLKSIDPIHWCIFGNRNTQADGYKIYSEQQCASSSSLPALLDMIPKGRPSALYGMSTTNAVLKKVLVSIRDACGQDACHQIPPLALQLYCRWLATYYNGNNMVAGGMAQEKDRLDETMTLTKLGNLFLSQESECSNALCCEPLGNVPTPDGFYIYIVFPKSASRQAIDNKVKIHSTNQQSQCSCLLYEQHAVACRHIVATLQFLHQNKEFRQRHELFDHSAIIQQCFNKVYWSESFKEAFWSALVDIPSHEQVNPCATFIKGTVLPPPRYYLKRKTTSDDQKSLKDSNINPKLPKGQHSPSSSNLAQHRKRVCTCSRCHQAGHNEHCCNNFVCTPHLFESPPALIPGIFVPLCNPDEDTQPPPVKLSDFIIPSGSIMTFEIASMYEFEKYGDIDGGPIVRGDDKVRLVGDSEAKCPMKSLSIRCPIETEKDKSIVNDHGDCDDSAVYDTVTKAAQNYNTTVVCPIESQKDKSIMSDPDDCEDSEVLPTVPYSGMVLRSEQRRKNKTMCQSQVNATAAMLRVPVACAANLREFLKRDNGDTHVKSKWKGSTTKTCIPIAREDVVGRTEPGGWFNDELINHFLGILWNHHEDDVETKLHFSVFSSHFGTNLGKDEWDQVLKFKPDILKTRKKAFFPINIIKTHWFLVVVDVESKKIISYDSLLLPRSETCKKILDFLERKHSKHLDSVVKSGRQCEAKPFEPKEWTIEDEASTMHQGNNCDCGVYICMMTYCIMFEIDWNIHVNPRTAPYLRDFIFYSIMKGIRKPDILAQFR